MMNLMIRWVRGVVIISTSLIVTLSAVGQVARDRTPVLGLLMYLPPIPIGFAAIAVDAAGKGRSWKRTPYGLAALGLMLALGGITQMIGRPLDEQPSLTDATRLKVLHWNVIWGGARSWNVGGWKAIQEEILERDPDLLILSEAPSDDRIEQLIGRISPRATTVKSQNLPGAPYMYKMVVVARSGYSLKLIGETAVRNGRAMRVEVGCPDRTFQILIVDGQSNPMQSRFPFLEDLSKIVREQSSGEKPIDLVVGDFNCVRRSLGFDRLLSNQYHLASESGGYGWRGTFPSPMPLYDIDHIIVRSGWADVRRWQAFTNFASDHRGQVVSLDLH